MAGDEHGARRIFALEPLGPEVSPHAVGLAAQSGGQLVGAIVDGAVRTWLVDPNGQLVLIMWPRGFRARFDPLELLDEHGKVVARGGEVLTVGGGFLKSGDPRSLGHQLVFCGSRVSRRTPTDS
jgi:hypothetical protein